jgi:proline iminopeptidase
LALARIECHYVLHGRYDAVTPMNNAFDLSNAWPSAALRVVSDAGHAMTQPGIVHAPIAATRMYAGD